MTKLVKVEDDDVYTVWKAGEIVGSDWPVFLFVKMMRCSKYDREWAETGKYHMSIEAVAPQAVSANKLNLCLRMFDYTQEDYDNCDPIQQCRLLAEYGIYAPLWQEQGSNKAELLKAARQEVDAISMLFGFYMDKPVNAIGSTGWDFIKGELGLERLSLTNVNQFLAPI